MTSTSHRSPSVPCPVLSQSCTLSLRSLVMLFQMEAPALFEEATGMSHVRYSYLGCYWVFLGNSPHPQPPHLWNRVFIRLNQDVFVLLWALSLSLWVQVLSFIESWSDLWETMWLQKWEWTLSLLLRLLCHFWINGSALLNSTSWEMNAALSTSVGAVSLKGDELCTDSKEERLSMDADFLHPLPLVTFPLFHVAACRMLYPFVLNY